MQRTSNHGAREGLLDRLAREAGTDKQRGQHR